MGQFHSISHSGMKLFEKPIESTIGGIVIDLASSPLSAGEHRLAISAGIGGVEIYLPRYAKFVVEGSAVIGGQDVHEGVPIWDRMLEKMKSWLQLPAQVPQHAVENPHPDQEILIRIAIDGAIGGLDIYRV
jgi:Cell wall-active antibiotics response 4TMS YvqF